MKNFYFTNEYSDMIHLRQNTFNVGYHFSMQKFTDCWIGRVIVGFNTLSEYVGDREQVKSWLAEQCKTLHYGNVEISY